MSKHYLILGLILAATFILRFPSLFEPFWYGDEGIFAAVAHNLNQGGILYQDAWDNKPPAIYLTYGAIFKIFGVSMFWLRLVTAVVVLATAVTIYEIAKNILGRQRALAATFIFGFLTSLRLVEGNLALTEIWMILPITAGFLLAIKRNFDSTAILGAAVLIAIGSLYKQVGALEAAALGIFLFLISKNWWEFFKKGLILTLGFLLPYILALGYFASKNLIGEFIFAAYTYYQIYLGESPKYAILINILKFMPIISAVIYGLYKSGRFRARTIIGLDNFQLILLWMAFAFLGSFFSGRTYGHYLVQAIPSLSIVLASINYPRPLGRGNFFRTEIDSTLHPRPEGRGFRFLGITLTPIIRKVQIFFAISFFVPLIFLTKLLFADFLSGGPINQISWWRNFEEFYLGGKNVEDYNNFFDQNVNRITGIRDFLRVKNAQGAACYIWGDWPWLYAIADLKNPVRYVTSFHVFGVPDGRQEVGAVLETNPPTCIIKPPTSIGYFAQLERILAQKYTFPAQVEDSQVYFVKD